MFSTESNSEWISGEILYIHCVLKMTQLSNGIGRNYIDFDDTSDAHSLWIIRETDNQWIPPPYVKFLWLFDGSEVCLPDSATATQLCWHFHQYADCVCAARTPVDCSELHQQPMDAVLRPTFVQKLCYKLPSVVTLKFRLQTFVGTVHTTSLKNFYLLNLTINITCGNGAIT